MLCHSYQLCPGRRVQHRTGRVPKKLEFAQTWSEQADEGEATAVMLGRPRLCGELAGRVPVPSATLAPQPP